MTSSAQPVAKATVLGCWAHSYAGPTTSFLVETPVARLGLDVGCDPIGNLRRAGVDPTMVEGIYLSHLHSDHASGLANLVFTRQLLGRRKSEPPPPLIVMAHDTVLEGAQQLVQLQYPERALAIEWIGLVVGTPHQMSDEIVVEIFENTHTVPCYGLVVRIGDSLSVAYTADTAPTSGHASTIRGCQVLIGECFGLPEDVGSDIHRRGHSTADDLAELVRDTEPRLVIPFHFGDEYADRSKRELMLARCAGGSSAKVVDPVDQPTVYL